MIRACGRSSDLVVGLCSLCSAPPHKHGLSRINDLNKSTWSYIWLSILNVQREIFDERRGFRTMAPSIRTSIRSPVATLLPQQCNGQNYAHPKYRSCGVLAASILLAPVVLFETGQAKPYRSDRIRFDDDSLVDAKPSRCDGGRLKRTIAGGQYQENNNRRNNCSGR